MDHNSNIVTDSMLETFFDEANLAPGDSLPKKILDSLPFMVWVKDTKGIIKFANQAYEEACGKPYEFILGKTDYDIWERKLADQYVQDDLEVIYNGKNKSVEEKLFEVDKVKWYETHKSPIYDAKGRIIGIVGSSKDITIRKNLEHELELQKRFLKMMIDAIPDLVFYKDVNSCYLGANKAFAHEFMGMDENEIIGKTDHDFVPDKELAQIFIRNDMQVIQSQDSIVIEEPIKMKDGRYREIETVKTPFRDENGQVAGIIGIARDITTRKELERTLRQQNQYLSMLLNTIPSAVLSTNNERKITSWNKRAEEITGYSAQEIMDKKCKVFSCNPCKDVCAFLAKGSSIPVMGLVCQIKTKDGQNRYVSKNIDTLRNEDGEIVGRIECFDDITEKLQIEERLKESELRLKLSTKGGKIGLWDWNIQSGEAVFDEQWANMIGYTLEELGPVDINTWIQLSHPEDLKKAEEILEKCFLGELDYYEAEVRMKHKNGHWKWVLDRGEIIEWKNNKPLRMVGTHVDINELAEAYEQQKILATTDSLTKLYNRREMINRMEYEKTKYERNKAPFTVIIGDIDYFKKVNDNYGHECGDLILQRTGDILKENIRKQDSVARWGGEEFLLLLPDTTVEQGSILAEKLRVKIQQELFHYNEKKISITITFGVSAFSEGRTLDDLIQHADKALYNGKENGRNCVVEN